MSGSTVVFEKEHGTEYSKIWAEFKENGDLSISGVDGGPLMEKSFNSDDYEYGMTIAKADLVAFAEILTELGSRIEKPTEESLIDALKGYFEGGQKYRDLEAVCCDRGMDVKAWHWY